MTSATTRKTTTRKAQIAAPVQLSTAARIAAPVDLEESYADDRTTPLLDALMAQDDVFVDPWSEDETAVVFLGADAVTVVHGDVESVIAEVASRLRRGWGREGDLPDAIEVERHDGLTPVEGDVTARTIFRPHVAGRTASWRLIEESMGERVAR